jgi:uroporphyrinogen-III synthase
MKRILVLRSGGAQLPRAAEGAADVVLLPTHEVVPVESGVAAALAFEARGATAIVSSKVTVDVLRTPRAGEFWRRPFAAVLAVGEETARELRSAGVPAPVVPPAPGAAGVLEHLKGKKALGLRILWPRGADADAAPVGELRARGAGITAPVVYEKRPRRLSTDAAATASLEAFRSGGFGAVAVGSMAALDAFLAALGDPAPADLPRVKWGVLGPETARLFEARGLPAPAVPLRARLSDLIDRLRNDIGSQTT